jgi:lipoate-protein ligase A
MTHHRWRLLIQEPLPPPLALAIDEAIARRCHENGGWATLRFYQWDRPAISLGRFQVADRAVRLDQCRAEGIPLIRRITGGRAVWHHRELTYSITSPLPSGLFSPRLQDAVAVIGQGLLCGLKNLGIPAHASASPTGHTATTSPPRPNDIRQSAYCFANTSWYEITCQDKKLIGSAQRRWRDRLLQQGSILLHHEPEAIRRWLIVDESALNHAIGLASLFPQAQCPALAELARRLAAGMAQRWGISMQEDGLTVEEQQLAEQLAHEKYADAEWTMRREASTIKDAWP